MTAVPTPTSALLATITATVTQGIAFSTIAAIQTGLAVAPLSILDPSHPDPTRYNPGNPLVLFIIQVFVIIGLARVLGFFLGKIRQPRVISEVIGGILLGPTAFGRIPDFTSHIFPPASISYLTLVSELGLVLFLFLIGLEVDFSLFKANLKISASVAAVGMAIPFGLGCATSVGLYSNFIDPSTTFTHFMLFIGTSMSITAFPVLARILTELNLVNDKVGVIVLSAGVANDVIGWILLALTIALVGASSGVVVVYILLCAVGWALCLWFIIRPVFYHLARRSGSFNGQGPTQSIVCLTLLIVLASAWITDQTGVNAIFGGFLAGLIIPRERGFATHLTEKIEDLVTVLLVPIYFALSGLKTNLALLNSGIIWAYVVCVIVVAFSGKFFGCAVMARWCGFTFRESGAVGALMSCKGLIELIVLNIGFTAGVISAQVFAIFVLEALTLTFLSTPLALAFYPPQYRHAYEHPGKSNTIGDGQLEITGKSRSRFVVVLWNLSDLSPVMIFTKLLSPLSSSTVPPTILHQTSPPHSEKVGGSSSSASSTKGVPHSSSHFSIDTIRLLELTERTSALMHASHHTGDDDSMSRHDPLSSLFQTFTSLNAIAIGTSTFSVVPHSGFAETVIKAAKAKGSEFILVPWALKQSSDESVLTSLVTNPFETFFDRATGGKDDSAQHSNFVRQLFVEAKTDVGIFIDRGSTASRVASNVNSAGQVHLFLPFHGGSDDRTCLEFILQLAQSNRMITATVVRIVRSGELTQDNESSKLKQQVSSTTSGDEHPTRPSFNLVDGTSFSLGQGGDNTIYGTHNHLASSTADEVAFARAEALILDQQLPVSLSKIETTVPLRASVDQAKAAGEATSARLIVIAGRGRRDATSHRVESADLATSLGGGVGGSLPSAAVRKCFGEVGSALVVAGVGSNILIIQCRTTGGAEISA